MSEPVASCSSPRVGRRTFVRIPACRPVPWPAGNSCEAGSLCFATSAGAAAVNAAPDMLKCQVSRVAGSHCFASTMLTVGSRLFAVTAAERGGDAFGIPDALHQHVDAIGAPEQLIVEHHGGYAEHAEIFGLVDDAVVFGARVAIDVVFEIRGRAAD